MWSTVRGGFYVRFTEKVRVCQRRSLGGAGGQWRHLDSTRNTPNVHSSESNSGLFMHLSLIEAVYYLTAAGPECSAQQLAAVSIQCSRCVLPSLSHVSGNSTHRLRFETTLLLLLLVLVGGKSVQYFTLLLWHWKRHLTCKRHLMCKK